MADPSQPAPTLPIVVSVIWGALLLPGLAGAALSVMFFDAPGSIDNPVAWANALIVVSFPCLCVAAIVGSWIVWAWRKRTRSRFATGSAVVVAGLPLIPVAYVAVALAFEVFGAVASGQTMGVHSTMIAPLHTPTPKPHR
ncbi:MAG TPA: hypothetical protein VGF86_06105 [Candidatus Tumulicola sp.]